MNTASHLSKIVSRPRSYAMENMEKLLLIWIEDCNQKRIPLSQKLIKSKGKGLYEKIKEIQKFKTESETNETFFASSGWFERFKHRTGFENLQLVSIARLHTQSKVFTMK